MSRYSAAVGIKSWLILLVGTFLAAACSSEPQRLVKQHSFSYQGDYYPSFLPSSTISIMTTPDVQRMWLSIYQYRDTVKTLTLATSAALSPADQAFFATKLAGVPVLKMRTKEQLGTDGITVYNTISRDSVQNKFHFWSPRKASAPQEHKLVEAVLGLARRKFTTQQEQEYFESLEQYFDFGLPCKVTSTNPFEVRMYGSLSSDNEQELTRFVEQLPSDRSILIDMTNFEGMGTMFYPLFQRLLARNPRIVWVASKWSQKQLQELGVPADRMTMTTAAGRALIQHLSSATK
jgi:hypothetical protein